MGLPEYVSPLTIVGLIVKLIGLVLFLVGFAGSMWSTGTFPTSIPDVIGHAYFGLFIGCNNLVGCTSDGADDWQIQAAGLEISGLVMYVATGVILLLYIFVCKPPIANRLRFVYPETGIIGCVFIFAGCIIWSVNRDTLIPIEGIGTDLDWSFYLALFGGILLLVASLVLGVDSFLVRRRDSMVT